MAILKNDPNDNIPDSESFKFKAKITVRTLVNGTININGIIEIAVSLK